MDLQEGVGKGTSPAGVRAGQEEALLTVLSTFRKSLAESNPVKTQPPNLKEQACLSCCNVTKKSTFL